MDYLIRPLRDTERPLLEDFLYEAIFLPDDSIVLPREIIQQPELQVYIADWGKPDDRALVAECGGKVVGCVWTRIMPDYGHIDDETPSFGISLYRNARGHGIGTALMHAMLTLLKENGYRQASLSVQKENYAVRMYQKVGFAIIGETEEEYLMLCNL